MDIAVIGLAVMGQNLILNMDDKGYKVLAYNRTASTTKDFINIYGKSRNIVPAFSIEELVSKLSRPRKIMLMVKSGEIVDSYIQSLLDYLEPDDIIIDGGNSNYLDTQRRYVELKNKGIHFIGAGISGGEEGARFGPSIMPGGSFHAWKYIEKIFKDISAKTASGNSCCEWIGSDGSGHFVKMVHNGIEYGDMQIISESYEILRKSTNYSNEEMSKIYHSWQNTKLNSYLIDITSKILAFKDDLGEFVLDNILDVSGQKGTGKWTSINSLELSVPLTLITESVYSRIISAKQECRVTASKLFKKSSIRVLENPENLVEKLKQAVLFSKIISYTQGFMMLKTASDNFKWHLNLGEIALLWREGCIIKSVFLEDINTAYTNKDLSILLLDDYFKNLINETIDSARYIASFAINNGIAIPAMTSALSFFDSITQKELPANLIQAQRDYFGAHTYERKDKPRGEFFHTDWLKTGGVSSTNYNA